MPSFDIVSEVNQQEVKNAIDQAVREITTRYDFKDSKSKITLQEKEIQFLSDDEFKMKAVIDIVQSKLVKRGVDLKSVDFGKVEPGPNGLTKCSAKIVSGIETEKAKQLVKMIKDLDMKVQASIQGDQVRVTGKKRDELQDVISKVKASNFPLPLQFTNYRD